MLLLDEPTSNLDLRYQLEILALLRSVVREQQLSAVMAIHDLNLALRYSDRLALLAGAQVLVAGTPDVLTEAHIRDAYGVDVQLVSGMGRRYVIPLEPMAPAGTGVEYSARA